MSSMDNFYEILKKHILDVAVFDPQERQELYNRARHAMMMQFECQSLSFSKEEMVAQFAIFDGAVAKLEEEAAASYIEENVDVSKHDPEIDSASSCAGLEDEDKQDVKQIDSAVLLSMLGNGGNQGAAGPGNPDSISITQSSWVAAARRGVAVAEGKLSDEETIPMSHDPRVSKVVKNYLPPTLSKLNNAGDAVINDKRMASLLSHVSSSFSGSFNHMGDPFACSAQTKSLADANVNMISKMPWLNSALQLKSAKKLVNKIENMGSITIFMALFLIVLGGGYWFYGDSFETNIQEVVMNTIQQGDETVSVEPGIVAQSPNVVVTPSIVDKSLTKYQGRLLSVGASMERAILKIEDNLGVSGEESFDGSVEWKVVGTGEQAKLVFLMTVPHRGTYLEMHLQRDIRPEIQSEYIVDLFYSVDNASVDDRIQKVSGIMISDSIANEDGIFLRGRGTLISRGHYVIEMLGNRANDMKYDLDSLRSGKWMMVPVVFENQSRSMFMAQKGDSGAAAVNKVLREWGQ